MKLDKIDHLTSFLQHHQKVLTHFPVSRYLLQIYVCTFCIKMDYEKQQLFKQLNYTSFVTQYLWSLSVNACSLWLIALPCVYCAIINLIISYDSFIPYSHRVDESLFIHMFLILQFSCCTFFSFQIGDSCIIMY